MKTKQAKRRGKIYGRQGDVALLYSDKDVRGRKRQPREGGRVVLAHGDVTGHAHAIEAAGADLYLEESRLTTPDATALLVGLGGGLQPDRELRTPAGAVLRHEEHGPIKPLRKHTVRRQVEYSPRELRSVAD